MKNLFFLNNVNLNKIKMFKLILKVFLLFMWFCLKKFYLLLLNVIKLVFLVFN